MVFVLTRTCSLPQKSSVRVVWLTRSEIDGSGLCPRGCCFWQTEDASLQLKRDHRGQTYLKSSWLLFLLCPCFIFAWALLGCFPLCSDAWSTTRMTRKGAALWRPVPQSFLPLHILSVTEHGQGGWRDPFLAEELVALLLQIWLPPIFMMKISKATFADYPVFPASSFWIINFWKGQ